MLLHFEPTDGLNLATPAIFLNYIPIKGIGVWSVDRSLKIQGVKISSGSAFLERRLSTDNHARPSFMAI
jgi:hypothetical protein